MSEKLYEALSEAVAETDEAVEAPITVEELMRRITEMEAQSKAREEELEKLRAENQARAKAKKGNSHLAGKTDEELIKGVKGLPVQLIIRYGHPGSEKDVIVDTEQKAMSTYGTKTVLPGMSLQSSDTMLEISDWGETRFLLQGKLVLIDKGRSA